MKYKLISCNVFQRELCLAIAETPVIVDPEFLELGLHERREELRSRIQERIDAASDSRPGGSGYDAIILGYGLCGNGLAGVEARSIPVVLPRAHDCCTVLMGSGPNFLASFGDNRSAPWSSAGYIERGQSYFRESELGTTMGYGLEYKELVEKYGEENASFVWETMHPETDDKKLRYIEIPETSKLGYADMMKRKAAEEGKDFVLLPGSMRMLRALVAGAWDPAEFLVVPPGKRIVPLYDFESVFVAE